VLVSGADLPSNKLPNVITTNDITTRLPVDKIDISGTASDEDGSIVSYLWDQVSGPSLVVFQNKNNLSTSVSGFIEGAYLLSLTVTDNNGASSSDNISITVLPQLVVIGSGGSSGGSSGQKNKINVVAEVPSQTYIDLVNISKKISSNNQFSTSNVYTNRIQTTTSKLNIRKDPGGTVISQAVIGSLGSIIGEIKVGNILWYKIYFDDNRIGWVSSAYTKKIDVSSLSNLSTNLSSSIKVQVGTFLNVRNTPGGTLIGTVKNGTTGILESSEVKQSGGLDWVKVKFSDGKSGWVVKKFLISNVTSNTSTAGTANSYWAIGDKAQVITKALYVRNNPGESIVTSLPNGTVVDIIDNNIKNINGHQWIKIKSASTVGWVSTLYLLKK
jgi:uncharacterized protein YgiM (DUF1202 family)